MGRLYNAARNFVNDWIEPVCGDLNDPTISVIIPVYKPTHLDVVIQHLNKIAKSIEVVLVDDSGEDIPLQVGDNTDITERLDKISNDPAFSISSRITFSILFNTLNPKGK